jgi:YHS domain-containing protein
VACVVDPARSAILDEACRVFVNYETYYLSSAEATGKFNQAPWRYTGLVTDPVTHQRFQPTDNSPVRKYEGRLFYFSSASSDQTFGGDPEAYATPVVPYAGTM